MSATNRRNQTTILFKAGEIIFHEGARGDKMFIINKGEVKLTKKVDDLEVPLQNLKPGSIFGEMALIDNQPRSATAQAVVDTHCSVVSKLVFQQKMAKEVPTWMRRMFAMLVQRMRMMIVNASGSSVGIPGHQFVDVLYLLLQQGDLDDEDRMTLPWDGIVERITFILGISQHQASAILKLLVGSGLAASHLDNKNRKVFVVKSLESFEQFDHYCKASYLVERRQKEPEDTAEIRRQEAELMGILKQIIGLNEGIHTIEIDELSRRLESEHKRTLDHYSMALKNLFKCKVLATAESKVGGLIYNINFDLYKSGDATDVLTPQFDDILKKIARLGQNAETVESNQSHQMAALNE